MAYSANLQSLLTPNIYINVVQNSKPVFNFSNPHYLNHNDANKALHKIIIASYIYQHLQYTSSSPLERAGERIYQNKTFKFPQTQIYIPTPSRHVSLSFGEGWGEENSFPLNDKFHHDNQKTRPNIGNYHQNNQKNHPYNDNSHTFFDNSHINYQKNQTFFDNSHTFFQHSYPSFDNSHTFFRHYHPSFHMYFAFFYKYQTPKYNYLYFLIRKKGCF